jgi:hypothetical protein
MKIRPARHEDLAAYASLQAERWTDENQASMEDLETRLKVHPQGMLVAEDGGRIVGMVYAMRISKYDLTRPPSWYQVTNNGRCDNHDPDGAIIFGVDLSTAVGVGARAGDKLLVAIGRLAVRENIRWCMLGGRMPGYHAYRDQMSADEYLAALGPDKLPLDPQVRFYTGQAGLVAVKAIPDYFADPESCNYGVLLRWRNPLFGLPGRRFWSACFPVLFRLEGLYLALTRKLASLRG